MQLFKGKNVWVLDDMTFITTVNKNVSKLFQSLFERFKNAPNIIIVFSHPM